MTYTRTVRTSPFVSSNLLSFPQPHLRFLLSLSSCLSGLSGLDLQHAYGSLLKVKKTIVYEESEEDSEVDQQVDTVLSVEVEAGRASGMTRVTKWLSTNSLPAVSCLLQRDCGDIDQVEDHVH